MSPQLIFFLGALVVAALLVVTELLARAGHTSFLRSVLIGYDNRTSTSKTFIFMWTLLVAWAIISLLIAGVVAGQQACAALTAAQLAQPGAQTCLSTDDKLGLLQLGWQQFLDGGLSANYLVLLGVPAAAGVASKVITQSKDTTGTVTKSKGKADQTVAERVSQVFSADDGTTDIGDFQYVVFNLITAAVFVGAFLRIDPQGLPTIPDTLLGLTSVSAALYVSKKAAGNTQPAITGVFPSILAPEQEFVITGSNLTADSGHAAPPAAAPPTGAAPAVEEADQLKVTINGTPVDIIGSAVDDRITAKVPAGLVPGNGPAHIAGKVQVLSAFGATTPTFEVQLSKATRSAAGAPDHD